MRRLAVLIAMIGLTISSRAGADPFDNLSQNLERYDRQLQNKPAPRQQAKPQSPTAAGGSAASSVRQTAGTMPMSRSMQAGPGHARPMQSMPANARPMARQASMMAEEVQPEPMPQDDFGLPAERYYPGDMWQEPMGSCGDCCDVGCGGCGGGFWGRAEYLAWWVRGAYVPPLVTTSPDGTPVGSAGRLPNATILFGDERINESGRSGGRFTLGYWFDPCNQLGIENTFFFIGGQNQGFSASSSGSPILARPFYNVDTEEQDSLLIAYPQVVVGAINITSGRSVLSNELNLRRNLYDDCCRRIDVLAGYRYFRLSEYLHIRENNTSLESTSLGAQFAVEDIFNTGNNFNGGQIGLNLQIYRGCWTWDFLAKLALGGVSQRAVVDGSTVITVPGEAPLSYEGGILALGSNIGQHDQTVFGVLPEFNINLRYQWSPLWRLNIGYTFMALTNVLRPGDQIDLRLDPDQFPPGNPGTFPVFAFNQSDVWLQGINFGIECNF